MALIACSARGLIQRIWNLVFEGCARMRPWVDYSPVQNLRSQILNQIAPVRGARLENNEDFCILRVQKWLKGRRRNSK